MPWRDEALVTFGESARDLARHFIQRWNQCKREKVPKNNDYPYLLPKAYSDDLNINHDWLKDPLYSCDLQLTRSLDSWSGGITEREDSIARAYKELIEKAEHYIYIENQFFVTTCDERDDQVKNLIGKYLVQRIEKAYRENKKFRVYIVLPLLPGFETNSNAIQAVQYFNLRSINLGKYSIYKKLQEKGINNPGDYITIHGMRNWDVLMGNLITEIIYVHSKLMIVDDKYAICGSANINDRSLLGSRDSELAFVIKDTEFLKATFDGKEVMVGKYCQSLRKKIFKLHLGTYFDNSNKINVNDCISDEFYKLFQKISNDNTNAYDKVFKCIPSDNIDTFKDLASYTQQDCLLITNQKQV
jgi:phospholipase D1/2